MTITCLNKFVGSEIYKTFLFGMRTRAVIHELTQKGYDDTQLNQALKIVLNLSQTTMYEQCSLHGYRSLADSLAENNTLELDGFVLAVNERKQELLTNLNENGLGHATIQDCLNIIHLYFASQVESFINNEKKSPSVEWIDCVAQAQRALQYANFEIPQWAATELEASYNSEITRYGAIQPAHLNRELQEQTVSILGKLSQRCTNLHEDLREANVRIAKEDERCSKAKQASSNRYKSLKAYVLKEMHKMRKDNPKLSMSKMAEEICKRILKLQEPPSSSISAMKKPQDPTTNCKLDSNLTTRFNKKLTEGNAFHAVYKWIREDNKRQTN